MKSAIVFLLLTMTLFACTSINAQRSEAILTPPGESKQYPIVLAHGFNASSASMWGFNPDIIEALRTDGHQVYTTDVHPFNSVEIRARKLQEQIDVILEESGSSKVHIIAHSMGGLDARYLISRLGYSDRVASLSTISTPHHGTYIADALLAMTGPDQDDALNTLAAFLGKRYTSEDLAENPDLQAAFRDLSERNAPDFNAQTPDMDPPVFYQSWAGLSHYKGLPNPTGRDQEDCALEGAETFAGDGQRDKMHKLLVPIAIILVGKKESLKRGLIPNDGVVTVNSSKWGKFRGCIPADHLDEIGQPPARGDSSKRFDYIQFYQKLVSDLPES